MNTLSKLIVIVAAIFGLIFFWFFIKYNYLDKSANPVANPSDTKLPISVSLTEEEKLKFSMENFVRAYGTYQFGDFTNMESLKDKMTSRLWSEKENFIKEKKQELANVPKRYITFSSFIKKSDILSQSNDLIEMEVKYTKREIRGATIQGAKTIEFIDENGQEGKSSVSFDKDERAILKLVKENKEWKVDDILIK